MKRMIRRGISLCLMSLTACAGGAREEVPEGAEIISVADLYENTAAFDGRKVFVEGYGLFTENRFEEFRGYYTIFPGLSDDTASRAIKCRDADSRLLHATPAHKDRTAEAMLSSREQRDGSLLTTRRRVVVEGVFRAERRNVHYGMGLVESHDGYLENARVLSVLSERCDMDMAWDW